MKNSKIIAYLNSVINYDYSLYNRIKTNMKHFLKRLKNEFKRIR